MSVSARPIVAAGFAKAVEEVNQQAAPMYAATAAGIDRARPPRSRPTTSRISPAVATASPSHRCPPDRSWVDSLSSGLANMASASTAPPIAPAVCAGTYTATSRSAGPAAPRRPEYQADRVTAGLR